jgi:hypothetical protein
MILRPAGFFWFAANNTITGFYCLYRSWRTCPMKAQSLLRKERSLPVVNVRSRRKAPHEWEKENTERLAAADETEAGLRRLSDEP